MSEVEITRDIRPYYGETTPTHRWTATVDGEIASELWVSIDNAEIMQVETSRSHRRLGYAAALYRQAASEMTIYHAPASHRTAEGDLFANAVGGDSLTCRYGCCTDDEE